MQQQLTSLQPLFQDTETVTNETKAVRETEMGYIGRCSEEKGVCIGLADFGMIEKTAERLKQASY